MRGIQLVTIGIRRPSRQARLLWLLAALLIGALAACNRATDAGIPTASEGQEASPGEANAAQAETTPVADDLEDAAMTYSQCMRKHGLSEFPDADAEGRIKLRLGSIDPNSAVFREASDACRHLAPEGWGDTEADPGDAEVMLEFARCMRENGIPDYPDPDPNTGFRIAVGPGTNLNPDDPKVRETLDICTAVLQDSGAKVRIGG